MTGLIILPISMPNLNQSLLNNISEDGDVKANTAKINAIIKSKIAHKNTECQASYTAEIRKMAEKNIPNFLLDGNI